MKYFFITFISTLLIVFSSVQTQTSDWLWAKRAVANSYAMGQSIAVDNLGNSYVAGYFQSAQIIFGSVTLINASNSNDIFIVKFDPSGNVVWAKKFGGKAHDYALGIAVDNSGNCYFTGYYESPTIRFGTIKLINYNGSDVYISKLDPMGNVVWARSAGGLGDEQGTGIAVDNSGNSCITGYFTSSSVTFGSITLTSINQGGNDIFVAKYDANGNILWVKTSGGNNHESGSGIATDQSGNIWVTGWFQSSSITFGSYNLTNAGVPSTDIFTVKYNPDGSVAIADGVGGSNHDDPTGITVDISDNCYVCGSFDSPILPYGGSPLTNLGGSDLFVLKYDNAMNPIWAVDIGGIGNEGAQGISSDNLGNMKVVGQFNGSSITIGSTTLMNTGGFDFFVAEFNSSGNPINAVSAGSNASLGGCIGLSIDVDNSGCSLITGFFSSLDISFGDMLLKINGNIPTPFVAKYGASPLPVDICSSWTKRYNSILYKGSRTDKVEKMGFKIPTEAEMMTRNLAVDVSGNIYVAGYSNGGTTNYDYVTVKYDASGNEIWAERFDGTGHKKDNAYALIIDPSSNIYVTGMSYSGAASGMDIVTLKYDTWGNLLQQATYTSTGANRDAGNAIALSPDGEILYVAGETVNPSMANIDFIVVAYKTSDLSKLWEHTWNGEGNGTDKIYAAAADIYGIVVTGESFGGLTHNVDYATVRYSPDGIELFSKTYDGSGHLDYAFAVRTDAEGYAYVTGASQGDSTRFDYFTIKYDLNGGIIWDAKYDNIKKNDMAYDLAVDDSGYVYVTGASKGDLGGEPSNYDFATVKYNPSGYEMWHSRTDGGMKKKDIARSIALCKELNAVFVTGSSDRGVGHKLDYFTQRLRMDDGSVDWSGYYDGTAHKDDIAYNIVLRPGGCCVVLTGTSYNLPKTYDFTTIQGAPDGPIPGLVTLPLDWVPDYKIGESNMSLVMLSQNYPNPINPTTTIEFTLDQQAHVTLTIYNLLGQEITRLVDHELLDEGLQEFEFNASNLASGVYFYSIVAQGVDEDEELVGRTFTSFEKIIVVR